jgi:hypothetical protein
MYFKANDSFHYVFVDFFDRMLKFSHASILMPIAHVFIFFHFGNVSYMYE